MLEAPDRGEALRVLESHPGGIDLLLTDVVMPGLSGKQLAERMLERVPKLKVLHNVGLHRR